MTFKLSNDNENFTSVLDTAKSENVIIEREDGSRFQILPISKRAADETFPQVVEGVDLDIDITDEELLEIIREGRGGRIF
ncbi:MAG: prevent-host-death protein [Chitinispirillia bacterium]|nr:prevent-host-death protein [Chitinispirillia bacterium]MCL2269155.1 prevent-host-death protein [Chitinispirillia bacterium]